MNANKRIDGQGFTIKSRSITVALAAMEATFSAQIRQVGNPSTI